MGPSPLTQCLLDFIGAELALRFSHHLSADDYAVTTKNGYVFVLIGWPGTSKRGAYVPSDHYFIIVEHDGQIQLKQACANPLQWQQCGCSSPNTIQDDLTTWAAAMVDRYETKARRCLARARQLTGLGIAILAVAVAMVFGAVMNMLSLLY
jgi:hypothetical protein